LIDATFFCSSSLIYSTERILGLVDTGPVTVTMLYLSVGKFTSAVLFNPSLLAASDVSCFAAVLLSSGLGN